MAKKSDNNRVNVKARIDRHLRIVKDNIGNNKAPVSNNSNQNYNLYIVLFLIVFIFPVYPTLASFVYNNTSYDFYRGDIDTSSIIESYDLGMGGVGEISDENVPMLESADSFLSVTTILDDERDLSGTNEILSYEVRPGDSFSSIAYEFKVSTSSILWANDFTTSHVLRPGEIIKVPPVSGLIHQVQSGDTLSTIAEKYDIEESKIKSQNLLSNTNNLKIGDVLVIPGAVKKVVQTPVYTAPKQTYTTTTTSSTGYSFAKYANSEYTTNKGSYQLVRRKPYSGVAGNCTWYVASYKNVDWRGNANQWLVNAAAKGHATGQTPKVGAIVQLTGTGYNPRYGHVAIVMEVLDDYLIVSDMNYRKLYEVTYRKIPINDRTIDGYIYID